MSSPLFRKPRPKCESERACRAQNKRSLPGKSGAGRVWPASAELKSREPSDTKTAVPSPTSSSDSKRTMLQTAPRPKARFPRSPRFVKFQELTPRSPAQVCSPPRLAATQLARSSVLNRLTAPAGLPPALTPASRAHQVSRVDPAKPLYLVRGKEVWL